jgi:hypothetical protein
MKRPRRRLNWVRVTRDPGVALAYEQRTQAGAEWTLALLAALRGSYERPGGLPGVAPPQPTQLALPLAEVAASA